MTEQMNMSQQSVDTAPAPVKKRKIASLDRRKARAGWLFVLPFVIGFIVQYVPILIDSIRSSFYVYDVANKQKVAEFDLRNYLSGFNKNIDFIAGIAADPNIDENGRFWGMISETLFTFTYDVETGKLNVKEELSYGKNTYDIGGGRNWFPRPFRFDGEGNLYVAFGNNGGIRRINMENISDNERVMPITPMHYVLGEDGNLW